MGLFRITDFGCRIATITTALLMFTACQAEQKTPLTDITNKARSDIQHLCKIVPENYAYYQSRSAYWPEACTQAGDAAELSATRQDVLSTIETLIDQLHDPHATLGMNSDQSPRLIPSGTDFWVEHSNAGYLITAIKPDSSAAKSGLQIGDQITHFNGIEFETALMRRIHAGQDQISAQRRNWAANATLAGYRHEARDIGLARNEAAIKVSLGGYTSPPYENALTAQMLSDDIVHIRFNNSLGWNNAIGEFEAAVKNNPQASGWILDLRDTPGGGNTDVTEPIMGWFFKDPAAYQLIEPRDRDAYLRELSPSPKGYIDTPVVVLVGRWTGSMGEGMAIGFDGTHRGEVLGSTMAGLAGGTEGFTLPETGIRIWLPTYNLAHIDGTPRHLWQPTVQLTADNGNREDLLLGAAISQLQVK